MESNSIMQSKRKSPIEAIMARIFLICGLTAVIMVLAITVYILIAGGPAIAKAGILNFFSGLVWTPTAVEPSFGILPMILASIVGTCLSVLIGAPIGILTAIFLAEVAPKKLSGPVRAAVELLAGIPSVVYGLVGMIIIVPFVANIENSLFAGDPNHVFTGGANLLSAILVLAIMILPTVVSVSETALRAVPHELMENALALGSTRTQAIFKVMLPAARSGLAAGIVLGTGRALGEAMAILMVSGNVVSLPLPFASVRFLTTGIVSEMSYASGLHREVLFGIGLVLFMFIMIVNFLLRKTLKRGNDR